jgi:hypothetical protein
MNTDPALDVKDTPLAGAQRNSITGSDHFP